MEKLPIIALAHTTWKGRWMNRQHILSRLGKRGWPIIYSNGVPYTWSLKSSLNKNGIYSKIENIDNVKTFLPGLCIPRSQRFQVIDRIAIKLHCKRLKQLMGLSKNEKFIVICFDPDFYPYVQELNPTYTALHMYDIYSQIGSVTILFNLQLEKILKKADLVTASTQYLLDIMASGYKEKSHVVFNSADYESIHSVKKPFPDPVKLRNISHPRIGYLGAINRKVDFESILNSIENNVHWQWIFMGPVNKKEILNDKHAEAFNRIQTLSNTHFIGEIDRAEIPFFLSSMDVNILCLRTDDQCWAKHSYPLKLNEYLATGLPIVSTMLPVVQKECGNLIYFASSTKEWEIQLKTAIEEINPDLVESRKKFAKENSWDHRVNDYENLLKGIVFKKFE